MKTTRIKILAIVLGIFSLFFTIYYSYFFISIFNPSEFFDIRILINNFAMLFFCLSPFIFIILIVSSIGLFQLSRWGLRLANIALAAFIVLFTRLIMGELFPAYFENTVHSSKGWIIFFHLNLRFETFVIPICMLLF